MDRLLNLFQSFRFIKMKKISFFLIFCSIFIFFHLNFLYASSSNSSELWSPQLGMVGSRALSLGATSPAISGDSGSVLINPASIADLESSSLSFNNYSLFSAFNYSSASFAFPFYFQNIPFLNKVNRRPDQLVTLGFTYGNLSLSDIPKTVFNSERIWAIDSYQAGFNVYAFTMGSSLYNIYDLNQISFGFNAKIIEYFNQGVSSRSQFGLGLDMGFIASQYFDHRLLNKVQFGFSAHNFTSSGFTWQRDIQHTSSNTTLPVDYIFGVQTSHFNDLFSLYLHQSNSNPVFAFEYHYTSSLRLRGAISSERYSLGSGVTLMQLPSFQDNQTYNLSFDYTFSYYDASFNNNTFHAFSLTFSGASKPYKPYILTPQNNTILTKKNSLLLAGVGPKKSTIYAYNNQGLSRTTLSNLYGNWKYKSFPLKPGKNVIYIQTKSFDLNVSQKSNSISVFYDNLSPLFKVLIYPKGNMLFFELNGEEQLSKISAFYQKQKLDFKPISPLSIDPLSPSKHIASIPLPISFSSNQSIPKTLSTMHVSVTDQAGNKSLIQRNHFFYSITFPQDKYVHYQKSIRILGNSSPFCKKLLINNNPVYLDKQYNFSIPTPLKVGKNLVQVNCQTMGSPITSFMRVLRLKTFDDIDSSVKGRREIEFLATLGVLPTADDLFLPDEPVTRAYITKLMVMSIPNLEIQPVEDDLFYDVPKTHPDAAYIQIAIQKGLMRVNPDGSFTPDKPLTLANIIDLLSKAGVLNYQDDTADDIKLIKKRELAEFLAYLPQYQIKINRLIDWDSGY